MTLERKGYEFLCEILPHQLSHHHYYRDGREEEYIHGTVNMVQKESNDETVVTRNRQEQKQQPKPQGQETDNKSLLSSSSIHGAVELETPKDPSVVATTAAANNNNVETSSRPLSEQGENKKHHRSLSTDQTHHLDQDGNETKDSIKNKREGEQSMMKKAKSTDSCLPTKPTTKEEEEDTQNKKPQGWQQHDATTLANQSVQTSFVKTATLDRQEESQPLDSNTCNHSPRRQSQQQQQQQEQQQLQQRATTNSIGTTTNFGDSDGYCWDLESAIHHVVNSRSQTTSSSRTSSSTSSTSNTTTQEEQSFMMAERREYLWTKRGPNDRRNNSNKPNDEDSLTKNNVVRNPVSSFVPSSPPWITFRMGHAGDVSELARLYRQEKEHETTKKQKKSSQQQHQQQQQHHQQDETTSLEVRLAEGMGDEDHPPVVCCLLAFVHEEVMEDSTTTTQQEDTGSADLPKNAPSTPAAETSSSTHCTSRLAAAVLLTEQLHDSLLHQQQQQQLYEMSGNLVCVEWMYVDKSNSPRIQRCVQSKLWLCLSSIGLLLKSPILVAGG